MNLFRRNSMCFTFGVFPLKFAGIFLILFSGVVCSKSYAESGLFTDGFTTSYKSISDGDKLIYRIDGLSDRQQNLVVKEVRGDRQEIVLSSGLGENGYVVSYVLSPDEETVVYLGSRSLSIGDAKELYSVPTRGGNAIKLNVPFEAPIEAIGKYEVTPDNKSIVYEVVLGGNIKTLYKASIGGGNSVKLGQTAESIGNWAISSDSRYLIFSGRYGFPIYGLSIYRADLSTGTVKKLSEDQHGFVDLPVITADSQSVIYDTYSIESGSAIYSVSMGGGPPRKLTPSPSRFGTSFSGQLVDYRKQHLYYVSDPEFEQRFRLFRVSLSGGVAEEVIANFGSDWNISPWHEIKLNSEGTHMVVPVTTTLGRDLYSVNLTTGRAVKLNDKGRVLDFDLSDNGRYVVYRSDRDNDRVFEVFSSAIDGGKSVKLNMDYDHLDGLGEVEIGFDINPDSTSVVYRMDNDRDAIHEIFEVSIKGGQSTKLSPTLPQGSDVSFPSYSGDGSSVFFRVNELEGVYYSLYLVDFGKKVSEFCFPIIAKNGKKAVLCL